MSLIRALGLGLLLALQGLTADAKPTPPSIAQLAAFPKMSGFTLSPDGTRLAALEARGEDRVILVWRTDALSKPPTVIGTSKMKFRSVEFIKDDLLAVTLWQPYDDRLGGELKKDFISKLYITDLEGKQWSEPMAQTGERSEVMQRLQAKYSPEVLSSLPNDPDHILVVNRVGETAGDVYKVNVRDGKAERVLRAGEHDAGYMVSGGVVRARLKTDLDSTGAYVSAELRNQKSGEWEEHFRSYVKNRDQMEIVGFSRDPNVAYVLSNVGRDKTVVYEYDIAARKLKEVLFEHKYFDASAPRFNRFPKNGLGEILGFNFRGPRGSEIQYIEPTVQSIDLGLRQAFKINSKPMRLVDTATGASVTADYDVDFTYAILDYSRDFKTLVLVASGAARPPEYFLYRDGKLLGLSKTYPDIDQKSLGSTELVYYKARDGLDIPAFLTKPNQELCGPAPWPAVVHPHGGPWARDTMQFDGSMWNPLMVSRCFAVLQPQYRGSAGWGRKLWQAGDEEWGQKMQDDKDDGAQWMIDQKIAKQGRIAMFGFSYGGYASMAAAVRPNGYYKCAIAGAGVSDIDRIWAKFYSNPFFREAQAHTVKGLSPRVKADQIKIPIMVYHGDRDLIVPIEQSEWFVDAGKKSGQRVDYHAIADYAHGPAWTRSIMGHQLQIIEDYLLKGCGGQGL